MQSACGIRGLACCDAWLIQPNLEEGEKQGGREAPYNKGLLLMFSH